MSKILALSERSVPRYTSYPTAPHFTSALGPDEYAAWLGALPPDVPLSLYIHVPYCTELCLYCGCNTKATRRRDPLTRYVAWLKDEIALVGALTGRRQIVHLHWGGGTPSILGAALLADLVDALSRAFDVSAPAEHAIELDPRRMSRELANTLAGLGVNRASLGVQDFSFPVQQAIGRIQPFDVVVEATDALRAAGIDRINIDLMYGLPHQTVADVANSARLAASLCPQRLALFGYAHVPWMKPHQRLIDEASLPGAAERMEQARVAGETLMAEGYIWIGLDHFALPGDDLAVAQRAGRLHRNFQGYTSDAAQALIGLGASAISHLPRGYAQNAPDIGSYSRAVEASKLATARGIAFTGDDLLRGRIIERLMCDLAVDLDALAPARFAAEIDALGALAAEGMVRIEGSHITVTEPGRLFVRLAAAAFDAYLPQNRARHSIAV